MTVHKSAETIQGRKLFAEIRYTEKTAVKNVCHEVISSKETFLALNPREDEKEEGEAGIE